ncbi:RrF2 family transcriptional regulator [Pseudahrensia aquimaris]|uniref:RrF2 family transcriptional regulator n=1 Tax=Pseudahrensia aquimaris TaxID=744461 RepID=A0ABW3FAF4_9HYPH
MRLNQASDFALRIMMLLAEDEKPLTVDEIAKRLNLVKSHVMKIVAKLVKAGFLNSQRGRSGGVSLGMAPQHIVIGEVVQAIEADFAIVECMQQGSCDCVFARSCRLKGVISDATAAFLDVLNARTLQSILAK